MKSKYVNRCAMVIQTGGSLTSLFSDVVIQQNSQFWSLYHILDKTKVDRANISPGS